MKITQLHLENFRGIKELDIDFGPTVTNIYGANGTGKTTIANAVSWLLFGKAATGEKDFNPKTVGAHNLHHLAEATFQTENGRIARLKKDFYEIWTKKKGSKTKTFSGNTTDYWVDDIPYKENVYTKTVQSFCGGTLEIAKLLTMFDYFPETMSVEERRKVLFEVCGDMTDDEVIAQTPELADLQSFLKQPGTSGQMYTPDEYKKIATDQRRKLNENLKMLPARIDEVTKSIPEMLPNEKAIKTDIDVYQRQIHTLDEEIHAIKDKDTRTAAIKQRIAETKTIMETRRAKYTSLCNEASQGKYGEIDRLNREIETLQNVAIDLRVELETKKRHVKQMEANRESLLDEWHHVNNQQWNRGQETCPMCKRPLPADQIEQMRKDWNAEKSKRLEGINESGRACDQKIIAALEQEAAVLQKKYDTNLQDTAQKKSQIAKIKETITPAPAYETTEEYEQGSIYLQKLQKQQNDESTAVSAAIAENEKNKNELQNAIQERNVQLATIETAKRAQQRIDELQQEQRQNSADLEELEHGLYLCDEFTRAKVRMITDNINNQFHLVHFKLFEEQLNGGLKELCEPMVQNAAGEWVDYRSANTAAQVNAGMDIISVLSDWYQIHLPVFIDRAESVTTIQNAENTQLIRLFVSPDDTILRVEAIE